MSNGIVTRKDFDDLKGLEPKLGILFETGIATNKVVIDYIEKTDARFKAGSERFEKIEKKALKSQLKDKSFSGMMGIVGGFIASYLKVR